MLVNDKCNSWCNRVNDFLVSIWDRRKQLLYTDGSACKAWQVNPTPLECMVNDTECYDSWVWAIYLLIYLCVCVYICVCAQLYTDILTLYRYRVYKHMPFPGWIQSTSKCNAFRYIYIWTPENSSGLTQKSNTAVKKNFSRCPKIKKLCMASAKTDKFWHWEDILLSKTVFWAHFLVITVKPQFSMS